MSVSYGKRMAITHHDILNCILNGDIKRQLFESLFRVTWLRELCSQLSGLIQVGRTLLWIAMSNVPKQCLINSWHGYKLNNLTYLTGGLGGPSAQCCNMDIMEIGWISIDTNDSIFSKKGDNYLCFLLQKCTQSSVPKVEYVSVSTLFQYLVLNLVFQF